MKNIISLVGIIAVLGVATGEARGVAMNVNIRRLLQEKQDKIAKLEECEGKKQGWMIAGISTIGLTAVGVGVNISQASKSNRLSGEIESSKYELTQTQNALSQKMSDINAKKAEKNGQPGGNGRDNSAGNSPTGGSMIEPFCGKVIDYLGETYPYAIISCVDNEGNTYDPEPKNGKAGEYDTEGVITAASVDDNGEFCFKMSVPRGANCSLGSPEMDPLIGTIEDLERYKEGVMMCRYLTSEILPIGTNCRVDGVIGEACENGEWSLVDNGAKLCGKGKIVKCECVSKTTPNGAKGLKRVVGGACIEEDIKKLKQYGWESGTYIRVSESANSKTLLKARCETKKGAEDSVPCNCKATACDTSKGYELNSNGLCKKE